MAMKNCPAFLACLAFLAWASPAAGQVIDWDQGQDPVGQFRFQRESRGAPASSPQAAGLVINAVEIGTAKFHRHDNGLHAYGAQSAWAPFIAPAGDLSRTPIVFDTANGVTIIFSHLEELLQAVAAISSTRNARVSVFNIHAHGVPGGTCFPKNEKQAESQECSVWKKLSAAPDEDSYELYYFPLDEDDIRALRRLSGGSGGRNCVTAAQDWIEVVARLPGIQDMFTDDARIRFLSCLVGLGTAGEQFSRTVARLLIAGRRNARVETALNFGLADWSMPEGMGFWDYIDDAQLERDKKARIPSRRDRAVMRNGTIRLTDGSGATLLIEGQYFLPAGKRPGPGGDQPWAGAAAGRSRM